MTPSEFFVGLGGLPTLRDRLPTRVIGGLLLSLVIVLILLTWTLSLSRGLERADETTKVISNLRMTGNQIAIELIRPNTGQRTVLSQALHVQDQALRLLAKDGASNAARIPAVGHIQKQFEVVTQLWNEQVKPAAMAAIRTGSTGAYLDALPAFMTAADRLAGMIEVNNDKKRTLLRYFQGGIAAIGSIGTGIGIYLLYVWIILPMLCLRDGLHRLTAGQFNTRLPVKTRDEFGVLAHGFNLMADRLEHLYLELDHGVRTKTAELEKQNREISSLYGVTAFLNLPNDSEALCRGFLQRVIEEFDVTSGTIRVLESTNDRGKSVISVGIPQMPSTPALNENVESSSSKTSMCNDRAFRILGREEEWGEFVLHLTAARDLSHSEVKLLETLGKHLGVALENRHLAAKARQLAVVHERNLMAQGLHDSIAQGLNFLKMQLPLLEDAMARSDHDDMKQIVALLRAGVDESYQDVRELLVNFRTKLDQVDLPDAIEDTIQRFRRQTGIEIDLDMRYQSGRALSPEQQLQVLFIMQEALSNVRKHARANQVRVVLRNDHDFDMEVIDNGVGYCTNDVQDGQESHIGLHIMHERADRLHAMLQLTSAPGAGASVRLILPHSERAMD